MNNLTNVVDSNLFIDAFVFIRTNSMQNVYLITTNMQDRKVLYIVDFLICDQCIYWLLLYINQTSRKILRLY